MSILFRTILPLALGLVLVLPASVWAQGSGQARGHEKAARAERPRVIVLDDDRRGDRDRDHDWDDDWDDEDRDGRRTIVLRDGRRTIVLDRDDFRRYPVRNDRGPSFCRSGAGHPVFGLQWCLNKGFGIGRPGSWFLRDNDLFLRDRAHVIVLRDRARDADRVFWSAVAGQLLAWID
ncbi:MAG TPA: hypothetical protein VMR66_10860 [Gemmatimonadota bacterium]|nr:hypothetical protein [Gemmatimonadota bacterium]